MSNVRPRVKPLLFRPSLLIASAAMCMNCWSAQFGLGDGLAPESAVKVQSAESQNDLDRAVASWVESHFPGFRIVTFSYQYIADDRALLVIRIFSGTIKRDVYFETPGLPVQFIPKEKT